MCRRDPNFNLKVRTVKYHSHSELKNPTFLAYFGKVPNLIQHLHCRQKKSRSFLEKTLEPFKSRACLEHPIFAMMMITMKRLLN